MNPRLARYRAEWKLMNSTQQRIVVLAFSCHLARLRKLLEDDCAALATGGQDRVP